MNRFYLVNAFEDEFEIGQFTNPTGKMSPITKASLQDNLSQCRERLQETIDAACYEDLHRLIEEKRAENIRKILEVLRSNNKLRPWWKKRVKLRSERETKPEPEYEPECESERESEPKSSSEP